MSSEIAKYNNTSRSAALPKTPVFVTLHSSAWVNHDEVARLAVIIEKAVQAAIAANPIESVRATSGVVMQIVHDSPDREIAAHVAQYRALDGTELVDTRPLNVQLNIH